MPGAGHRTFKQRMDGWMDGWTNAGADKNRVICSYTKMTTPLLFDHLLLRLAFFLPEKAEKAKEPVVACMYAPRWLKRGKREDE